MSGWFVCFAAVFTLLTYQKVETKFAGIITTLNFNKTKVNVA